MELQNITGYRIESSLVITASAITAVPAYAVVQAQ